jgi:DNA-binding MarR family transcriptional regulator
MGLLQDILGVGRDALNEAQLSPVLRERIKLAEDKYDAAMKELEQCKQRVATLEREVENLRAQVGPEEPKADLDSDTARVLVLMFKTEDLEQRDVGAMARQLNMDRSVFVYHLDRLFDRGFAESIGGNYRHGHIYWSTTPKGRRYIMERELHK